MFFKFNSLIGRLAQSSQLAAYTPQGLKPFSGSSPAPVFDSKTTKPALVHDVPQKPQAAQARESATAASAGALPHDKPLGIHPTKRGYLKQMEWQQVLCKQDGRLVWQKFPVDRVFLFLTFGLVMFGTAVATYRTFTMSFPEKKEE